MRHATDTEKNRIIWLIRFFSGWYNSKLELRKRVKAHILIDTKWWLQQTQSSLEIN